MEKVLTCLLTELSAEERRIRKGRCTLESVLVCPCIEVLLINESDCVMLGLVVMDGVLQSTVCGISVFECLSQLAKMARSVLLVYHLPTSTQSHIQPAFSKWLSPFGRPSQKLSPHSWCSDVRITCYGHMISLPARYQRKWLQ